MTKKVSPGALAVIRRMQQSELTESVIYEEIAKFARGEENRQVLLRLAKEERAHYEVWKRYTGLELKPERGKVFWYKLMARILGFTFAVKLMERGEESAQEQYDLLAGEVEESVAIRHQEQEHEKALLDLLDDYYPVKLISYYHLSSSLFSGITAFIDSIATSI